MKRLDIDSGRIADACWFLEADRGTKSPDYNGNHLEIVRVLCYFFFFFFQIKILYFLILEDTGQTITSFSLALSLIFAF